jgi:ABC-type transport system involved in multi-copper enzyme maturation permease subunit
MELFIPSVLALLLAAAVVFFVLPRFGPAVLAIVALILLAFGVYQHRSLFGSEYRLSTWQFDLIGYAPYIMVGGVLAVIAFYLISLSPLGRANTTAPAMPEVPTVAEMPPANTATNAVTAGVNNALKAAAATVGAVNAANKPANNKGVLAAPVAAVTNAASAAVNGVKNAITGVTNAITGNTKNATKPANTGGVAAALGFGNAKPANKGTKVPGLNFPLSQV